MTLARVINLRSKTAAMRLVAIALATVALALPARAQVPAETLFDQLKQSASGFIELDGSRGYVLTADASAQQQVLTGAKRSRTVVQATPASAQAAPAAQAAEVDLEKYKDPMFPEPADLQNLGMRLVLVTAGVLAACVISLVVAKRCFGVSRIARSGDAKMRVLETLPLNNRCRLQLIQADGHKILVGVDAAGLKSVLLLQDPFKATLESLETESTSAGEHGAPAPESPQRGSLTGGTNSIFQSPLSMLGKFPAFSGEKK